MTRNIRVLSFRAKRSVVEESCRQCSYLTDKRFLHSLRSVGMTGDGCTPLGMTGDGCTPLGMTGDGCTPLGMTMNVRCHFDRKPLRLLSFQSSKAAYCHSERKLLRLLSFRPSKAAYCHSERKLLRLLSFRPSVSEWRNLQGIREHVAEKSCAEWLITVAAP